ncbi:MAG: alpha/beta hydrolase [Candidatus Comchoanobacterales bacterium]
MIRTLLVFLCFVCLSGCQSSEPLPRRFQPLGEKLPLPQTDFDEYIIKAQNVVALAQDLRLKDEINPYQYNWTKDQLLHQGSPFAIYPEHGYAKKGFLIMHGLNDTPQRMRDIANKLHSVFPESLIYAPLMPGHGTLPGDMIHVDYRDWVAMAHQSLDLIASQTKEVYLVGYSTGGDLAVDLLLNHNLAPQKVKAMILISPAVELNGFISLSKYLKRVRDFVSYAPDNSALRYDSTSINAAHQVVLLNQHIDHDQPIEVPTLLMTAQTDKLISPQDLYHYFKRSIVHPDSQLWVLDGQDGWGDSRVIVWHQESLLNAYKMLSLDHSGMVISPNNEFYGYEGKYPDCRLFITSNGYNNCINEKQFFVYGAVDLFASIHYGPYYRISSFNPYFEKMTDVMIGFIKKH